MAQHTEDFDLPPLPPEVVNPDDGPDWVDALMDYAVGLAAESASDPAEVGAYLANWVEDTGWDDLAPPPAQRWRVTDDGKAEWAMAHVVDAEVQLQQLGAQADAWAQRIRQWFDHRAKPLQAKAAFFSAHLERYALDLRDQDPKARTLTLPSGAVKTTEQKAKAAVEDEAAVVAWVTCWFPEQVAAVCPPVQPKVYVNPLRQLTHVVEVIDHARLVLANSGEVVEWVRHGWIHSPDVRPDAVAGAPYASCPAQGDGWPSPEDATDLVAVVQVLASHPEVHDTNGKQVPGTKVEPGHVTAKVVPAP